MKGRRGGLRKGGRKEEGGEGEVGFRGGGGGGEGREGSEGESKENYNLSYRYGKPTSLLWS